MESPASRFEESGTHIHLDLDSEFFSRFRYCFQGALCSTNAPFYQVSIKFPSSCKQLTGLWVQPRQLHGRSWATCNLHASPSRQAFELVWKEWIIYDELSHVATLWPWRQGWRRNSMSGSTESSRVSFGARCWTQMDWHDIACPRPFTQKKHLLCGFPLPWACLNCFSDHKM